MTGYRTSITRIDDAALINLRCSEKTANSLPGAMPFTLSDTPFVARQAGETVTVRLAPDQWWVLTTLEHEQSTFELLKDATADEFAAVTVISDHFQGFEITGRDVDAVLAQATSIDVNAMSPGTVTRGKFARSGGTIFMIEPSNKVQVFVESSYADYIEAYLSSISGH